MNLKKTIGFHWITEPLYGLIIDGDDIADADFAPVSIGFAVGCGLTILSVIYTFIVGRKLINERFETNEKKDAESSL